MKTPLKLLREVLFLERPVGPFSCIRCRKQNGAHTPQCPNKDVPGSR